MDVCFLTWQGVSVWLVGEFFDAMVLPVGFQTYLLLIVVSIMVFNFQRNSVEACPGTVITACNDTNSCIQTYGEVYKLLGSNINYSNIAQALYPVKWLSSLLVHVTLNGANGTENSMPVYYTWSMSCLYAAFPENVLEVLAFGSILVASRTQDLNITIAPFCCNVSQKDRERMIENALASVSDNFYLEGWVPDYNKIPFFDNSL